MGRDADCHQPYLPGGDGEVKCPEGCCEERDYDMEGLRYVANAQTQLFFFFKEKVTT